MMELDTIVCGDCLDVMAEMPDGCVDLVFADPPHNKGLADWDKGHDWHPWISEILRILKQNGALWIDHSDIDEIMAISKHIVESNGPERRNFVVWDKFGVPLKDRWAFNGIWDSPTLRSWPQMAEYLIYHASEKAWEQQLDPLRGFVFEPLRAYLDGERRRAGFIGKDADKKIREALGVSLKGGGLCSHFWGHSQWQLPTAEHYQAMQQLFNQQGRQPAPPYEDHHTAPRSRFERDHDEHEYLRAEYEDLRAEYEDLRAEYECLRYTFNGPPGCGSVWAIPAWNHEADWHPTPKPEALLMRIIEKTSNEDDSVFDPFMGSGTTAVAALKLGRHFYGCDINPDYVKLANERIEKTRLEMSQLTLPEMG